MNIAVNFAALLHPFSLLFLLSAVFFFYDARKFLRTKKAIMEAGASGKLRKGLVKLAGEAIPIITETSPLGVKECIFYRTYVRHYGMDPTFGYKELERKFKIRYILKMAFAFVCLLVPLYFLLCYSASTW